MKYKNMTDTDKERAFAEKVLGWVIRKVTDGHGITMDAWYEKDEEGWMRYPIKGEYYWSGTTTYPFHPKTNLDHAFMGVEKLNPHEIEISLFNGKWSVLWFQDGVFATDNCTTPNEAIMEACLRVVSPELFTED